MQNIRWAVLGTGVIANEMAVVLKKNGRNIDAVGNRTHEKAVEFAEKYGIKKVYDNYNDMFTDPDIDVILSQLPIIPILILCAGQLRMESIFWSKNPLP